MLCAISIVDAGNGIRSRERAECTALTIVQGPWPSPGRDRHLRLSLTSQRQLKTPYREGTILVFAPQWRSRLKALLHQ